MTKEQYLNERKEIQARNLISAAKDMARIVAHKCRLPRKLKKPRSNFHQ